MDELSRVLRHRAPQLPQGRERCGEVVDHVDVLLAPRDPVGHSPRVHMPIKEFGPGHMPQSPVEGATGTEDTGPVPFRSRSTGQELAGRPAVHNASPVGGPQRQWNAEAAVRRQLLDQGGRPLDLLVGALGRLEHGPTDEDASPLPTCQGDSRTRHTKGVKDRRGRHGIARHLVHAGHPADVIVSRAPCFRPTHRARPRPQKATRTGRYGGGRERPRRTLAVRAKRQAGIPAPV